MTAIQPLRLAVVGTRGHQGQALREMVDRQQNEPERPQAKLVAVADGGDNADSLRSWAKDRRLDVASFQDHRDLLREAQPDLLVICGPFERHAEMCIDAVGQGVHVLTEKPATLTEAELATLRAACAANPGVHLAGMMFSRYDPGFLHAADLIARGAIGEVRLLNARKSYRLGKRPAYYYDRETYGGTIPWVGSHAIDWTIGYANAAPTRVYATHSAGANGGFGTMESSASVLLEFPNDVSATVSVDVLRPDAAPTHGDDWCRIVGTEGVIEAREHTVEIIDANGPRKIEPRPTGRTLVGELIDAIAGAGPCLIDTQSTLTLTATLLAARRSADERRVIEIDA